MEDSVIEGLNKWIAMNHCQTRAIAVSDNLVGVSGDAVYKESYNEWEYTFICEKRAAPGRAGTFWMKPDISRGRAARTIMPSVRHMDNMIFPGAMREMGRLRFS